MVAITTALALLVALGPLVPAAEASTPQSVMNQVSAGMGEMTVSVDGVPFAGDLADDPPPVEEGKDLTIDIDLGQSAEVDMDVVRERLAATHAKYPRYSDYIADNVEEFRTQLADVADIDGVKVLTREDIPEFDAATSVKGSTLTYVVPGSDVHATTNWWEGFIIAIASTAVGYIAFAVCLFYIPAFPPVCGFLEGFTGTFFDNIVTAIVDQEGDFWTKLGDVFFRSLWAGILGFGVGAQATARIEGLVKKAAEKARGIRLRWFQTEVRQSADRLTELGEAFGHELGELPPGVRLMPLGDSITAGSQSSDGNGYRGVLFDRLQSGLGEDAQVTFVGPQKGGSMPDRDHAGYPGYRIDEIATVADCSVRSYKPNVILLHAGTNDADQNFQLQSAPQRIKNLITQVLNDSPRAVVAVAEIIPTGKPRLQPRINAINAALPGVVKELQAAGKHVVIAHTRDLKVSDGLQGDAHPNDNGYAKLGADFARAVWNATARGWIQDPEAPLPPAAGCPVRPGDDDVTALGYGWRALGTVAAGFGTRLGSTTMAELNGDHRADYVQVADDGKFRVAMNTVGTPGQPKWVDNWGVVTMPRTEIPAEPGDTVRFADLDGDGRDDYLIVGAQGKVTAWMNKSSPEALNWRFWGVVVPSKKVKQDHTRFADLDGNGRDDYIQLGDDGSAHVYFNTPGEGGRPKWVLKSNWIPGTAESSIENVRFGDVDGDGKSDYLEVGRSGAVHAYLNRGSMDTPHFERHLNFAMESGYDGGKVQFFDLSDDGKADYTVIYSGGSIRAWLNRGGNI